MLILSYCCIYNSCKRLHPNIVNNYLGKVIQSRYFHAPAPVTPNARRKKWWIKKALKRPSVVTTTLFTKNGGKIVHGRWKMETSSMESQVNSLTLTMNNRVLAAFRANIVIKSYIALSCNLNILPQVCYSYHIHFSHLCMYFFLNPLQLRKIILKCTLHNSTP